MSSEKLFKKYDESKNKIDQENQIMRKDFLTNSIKIINEIADDAKKSKLNNLPGNLENQIKIIKQYCDNNFIKEFKKILKKEIKSNMLSSNYDIFNNNELAFIFEKAIEQLKPYFTRISNLINKFSSYCNYCKSDSFSNSSKDLREHNIVRMEIRKIQLIEQVTLLNESYPYIIDFSNSYYQREAIYLKNKISKLIDRTIKDQADLSDLIKTKENDIGKRKAAFKELFSKKINEQIFFNLYNYYGLDEDSAKKVSNLIENFIKSDENKTYKIYEEKIYNLVNKLYNKTNDYNLSGKLQDNYFDLEQTRKEILKTLDNLFKINPLENDAPKIYEEWEKIIYNDLTNTGKIKLCEGKCKASGQVSRCSSLEDIAKIRELNFTNLILQSRNNNTNDISASR